MEFQVTQEDIDRGVPYSAWWCPIAKSARRRLGPLLDPGVSRNGELLLRFPLVGGEVARLYLSQESHDFLTDFDQGRTVAPFTARVDKGIVRRDEHETVWGEEVEVETERKGEEGR